MQIIFLTLLSDYSVYDSLKFYCFLMEDCRSSVSQQFLFAVMTRNHLLYYPFLRLSLIGIHVEFLNSFRPRQTLQVFLLFSFQEFRFSSTFSIILGYVIFLNCSAFVGFLKRALRDRWSIIARSILVGQFLSLEDIARQHSAVECLSRLL